MIKYWYTLIVGFLALAVQAQSSLNISYVASTTYQNDNNDIWGYTDSSGVEYALVGTTAGVSIVDISANPIQKKQFIQGPYSIWRDLKTWGHYAYVTHDNTFVWNTSPDQGLLIIDLDSIDAATPRYKAMTAVIPLDTGGFDTLRTAHNLYIDENGYCYIFGANVGQGGALIFDLNSDPWNPQYVGMYDDEYFHDGMVRGDTLWGSAVYQGYAAIVDVSKKDSTYLMASQNTPSSFTHNTWVSDDNKVLYTTDERSNAFLTAYDVTDLNNITELDRIQTSISTSVIPHNAHVYGQWIVTSYYTSGVQIVDAKYPELLVEIGHYDTSPSFSGNGFNGNWGAYPYFESERIICTDIEEGLIVLEPNYVEASRVHITVRDSIDQTQLSNVLISFEQASLTGSTNLDGVLNKGTHLAGTDTVAISLAGYVTQRLPYSWLSGQYDTLSIDLVPVTNIGTDEWRNRVVEISPNPSNGNFHLTGVHQGTFSLRDISGRVLEQGKILNEQVQLRSSYPHGNYLLIVEGDSRLYRLPIVLLP